MPISFGTSESSGNSLFIRSNLPQNRWWVKTDAGDENIDMSRGFAVDISRVQFGWLHIDIGVRDWQPWPSPSEQIPRPSEQYKQGFEVKCWLVDGREASFSGNSYGLGQFIAKLYNQCEQSNEFATQIPIVQVTGSTPVVIGKGTSYDVSFNISKWINRPENGAEHPAAAAAPAMAPAPAPASPPPPPPAAAPAADNNFGF